MSFSYLALVLAIFFVPIVIGADPLFHLCFSSENFTANSPFEKNLNKLTSSVYVQSASSGFGYGVSGQDPNKAYGLALCRGDVSVPDCKTCVSESANEIRELCPSNKAAITWYDNCLFKYSDKNFFGQIDNKNKFYLWNINEVSDPVQFNQKTKKLLTQLAKKACGDPKLYKTGTTQLDSSTKLYGLVQCTRDLSSDVCKKCLDGIIGELPRCCDGKEGGRVVSGSCNFRYEIYPFVDS